MQHQDYAPSKEKLVIHGTILEEELKGRIKGLRDLILDVVKDHFSPQVVAQVQQTIAPSYNIEQLKKFLRQLVRLSDEQEVLALLTEYFPQGERKGRIEGKLEGFREAILDVAFELFSLAAVVHVNYVIHVCQDGEQLRKFLHRLIRLSTEEELVALILECFPLHHGIGIFTAKGYLVSDVHPSVSEAKQ